MEERQITVDGVTTRLAEPFMVMATQNPLESYGTFPLPEAQTDRFFMRLSMGYMAREQEMEVMSRRSSLDIVESLSQTVSAEDTAYVRREYTNIRVSRPVLGYMMDIVQLTRRESSFVSGVSTRGAIALYKAAQVTAALAGREYVIPEDVQYVAAPVLCHRLSTGGSARSSAAADFLKRIIESVPVPLEEA